MIGKVLRGLTRRRTDRSSSSPSGHGHPGGPGSPEAAPAAGVPVIEYRPRADGHPDPGEVVWAWVPYEDDPQQGKDRPVVVVGRLGADLAGVALTTKESGPASGRLAVGTGAWDSAKRPSFAKLDRILVLPVGAVRREGAAFDPARFDQLVTELRSRHRLVVPEIVKAGV